MITVVKGRQGSGKTTLMVAALLYHVTQESYQPNECAGNVSVPVLEEQGYRRLRNLEVAEYVGEVARLGLRHRVILVDEAARVFPARWWGDREQQEALIGCFQDEKLFNCVYVGAHAGSAYDKLLRDARMRTVVPFYNGAQPDELVYTVIDDRSRCISHGVLHGVRRVQALYDRWEFVD